MAWMQDMKTAGVTELDPLMEEPFSASIEGIFIKASLASGIVANGDNVISLAHERFKRSQRKQANRRLITSLDGQQLGHACQALYERQQQWVARLMHVPMYQDPRTQRGLLQILQINTQLFTGAIHAGSLSPWQTEVLLFRKNMLILQFDLPVEYQRLDGTAWSVMTINRTLYNTLCGLPVTQAGTPDLSALPDVASEQHVAVMQQAWSNAYLQQMMGLRQGLEVMLTQEEAAFNEIVERDALSCKVPSSRVSSSRSLWHRLTDAARELFRAS